MSTLNPLNDISRTYLDTIAKINQKEEETEIKRWEGELNLQMKTMANMKKEDKDYGYDKKGNSLNPADMEEKKKKEAAEKKKREEDTPFSFNWQDTAI